MKKLLFAFSFLFLTAPAWGAICRDTLRPNANGFFNNWDDCNTAGCAATASNYLRVNTDATTDTIAIDTLVGVCNTGSLRTSHHVADFSRTHSSIDTVRVRVKMWGTISTDSARIGMLIDDGVAIDTIWSARFQLTTTPTFYEFSSHTNPHSNGWEDANLDSLQICVEGRLATNGRIFDTEEIVVPVYQGLCPGADPPAVQNFFYMTQGQFATATATGNQTIDTGVDSVLKAIRFYSDRQTVEGYDGASNQSNFMGIAVSSTARKCVAWVNDDGVATTNAGRWTADSCILILNPGTPTINGAADFVSFGTGADAGKFTINWTDAPSAAWLVYYEAYYGGSLENVAVVEDRSRAAVGTNQGITGVGFQPNFIFFMLAYEINKGPSANGESSNMGVGMAAAPSQQCALAISAADNDGAGGYTTETVQFDTLCMISYNNALTIALRVKFISFDADGFTINARSRPAAADTLQFFALCLRGGNYQVGSFNSPTAGGVPQDQSVTTTFKPSGASFINAKTTSLSFITEAHLGFGAGNDSSGTVSEQSTWGMIDNVRNPTVVGMRNVSTKCITVGAAGSPPTTLAEADYKTQAATSFTVTWTTIDAATHKVWYVAFGPGEEAAGGGDNIRRQRLLRGESEEENEKSPMGLFVCSVAP